MKVKAVLCIAAAGILWGTSGIFSHYLRPFGFDALQMTTIRGVVSAIIMLLFVLITNPKRLVVSKKEIPFLLGSGIGLFGTASAYFASMAASSVSTAVILMYTAPIFVLIYSVMFLNEKLNPVKFVSIFLMLIGCALVSGIIGGMNFSLLGVVWGLIAGISYSAYNIFTKILTLHKVHTVTVTSYNFIIMSVIGLAFCSPYKMVEFAAAAPGCTISLMLGLGVCTCILPYLFYTMGLRTIPAGTATALGIIEPLSATVFSICFLGERLTIPLTVGMTLILGSVVILARQKEE